MIDMFYNNITHINNISLPIDSTNIPNLKNNSQFLSIVIINQTSTDEVDSTILLITTK